MFKFVENPENNEKSMDEKSKVKFKNRKIKTGGISNFTTLLVHLHCEIANIYLSNDQTGLKHASIDQFYRTTSFFILVYYNGKC